MNHHTSFPARTGKGFGPLVGLAVAFVTLGPGSARADDWPSLGLDGNRARISGEASGSRFDAGAWQHGWKTEDQISYRALLATPSVGDGYLAFATQRNLVRVVREVDGQLIWETKAGGTVLASPAIWRGLVFVFGGNQQLVALRLTDGAVVWQKDLGAMGYASPVVVDGSVYVATASPAPSLWRIDAATGKTLWQASDSALNTSALASVAISGGHALVVQMEGQVFSFAVQDGKLQWMAETHGRVALSSPLVVDGRVYVLPVSNSARLHALDLATGAPIAGGWPLDLVVPAPEARFGPSRERKVVVSSPAGGAGAIVLALRADDYFGSNAGGQPDTFLSQEMLFAVDAQSAKVLWSTANGRLETKNPNDIPNFEFLSTPALYRTGGGELLVAAASSVSTALRVFSVNGSERWTTALSAPTRGSPVFANGRLVAATDVGVVHSFLSATNQPPVAPVLGLLPAAGGDSDAARTTLRWGAAIDPEGQAVRYQVRVDDDGEVLRDWDLEFVTTPELQSIALPPLAGDSNYTFAVRARDSQGAMSAWTEAQGFRAVASAMVTLDDQPAASLADAIAAAGKGATIRLGAGVFALSSTLHVPAGVTLQGAGPHLTTLSGKGLEIAIAPGAGSQLRQLTIAGARIGVQVDRALDVHLRNVILRDNADVGLDVSATGSADLISATVVRNGVGVRAAGSTSVRNALVTSNDVGLQGAAAGLLASRYANVYQNRSEDYRNVSRADTNLAVAVTFDSTSDTDLRLGPAQPTTDKGDPGDEFTQEPAPNGNRINIGAFGNTPFAELSALSTVADAGAGSSEAPAADAAWARPAAVQDGCACNVKGGNAGSSAGGALGLLGLAAIGLVLRRHRRRR